MKNIWKWIIIAVLLVGIIAGASVLYDNLSKDYKGENLNTNSTVQSATVSEDSDFSAPDFTVLDRNGKEVSLSDYKGKPIVLNFWATWCYYCKEEMPDFNNAYKEYPDIQFLMVNATDGVQETMDSAKKYIKQMGFDFDVFYDTKLEAVNAYYVTGFPATFFIDKDGNLVTQANGMIDYETLKKGIGMITG